MRFASNVDEKNRVTSVGKTCCSPFLCQKSSKKIHWTSELSSRRFGFEIGFCRFLLDVYFLDQELASMLPSALASHTLW